MNTFERMTAVYEHREPDRVPITDGLWQSTVARWREEGLPDGTSVEEYFGWEEIVGIGFDNSPRFDPIVVEETDTYRINRDGLGQTHRNFKPESSTPEYIDSLVKDPETWKLAKERMTYSDDRVNWNFLEEHHAGWREQGKWIMTAPYWSFDIVCTRMCNSEIILYAMADNPGWVKEMCDTGVELSIEIMDKLWEAGYTFDELLWFDDMAYKNGLLFSKDMWREILMPYQKRYIDWAHAHDIKAHLHCCGRITELVPDLIELGVDILDPMEIKAGMDPLYMKKEFGKDLALRGGFDIQNWSHPEKAEEEIRRVLPGMMELGGYVFSSDHSIADSVSFDNYKHVVSVVKEVGKY